MGRADILLRFLQLIGKDRPQDIEPYLKELDDDTEHRPLADQVVDLIIAGDRNLYGKYEQARKDVGPRNPYSSPESQAVAKGQAHALGNFLSKWIALETELRKEEESVGERSRPFSNSVWYWMRHRNIFTGNTLKQIEYIRQLRNQAVHGIDPPSEATLNDAGNLLEQILSELRSPERAKKTQRQGKSSGKQTSE